MPKISQLPAAESITTDDLFVMVDNNVEPETKKVEAQKVLEFIRDNINEITLSQNSKCVNKISIRSPIIDFTSQGETNIFSVPSGFMFLIDSMEILTTQITGADVAPSFRFGNASNNQAYYSENATTSNSMGARHVIENPQNGIVAGITIKFGITVASTASSHEGVAIVNGSLIELS